MSLVEHHGEAPAMTDSAFWSRHAFVLISSDAVYRGVHGGIVRRLREAGFPPVAARALHVDPETIDDLYADLIAGQWQTWRYRMVDATLALGPAMVLICRHIGDDPDPHAALATLKGSQHPAKAAPGTLRHDFGSINAILGLLHSSDGPPESAREAAIFGLTPERAEPDLATAAAQVDYLGALHAPAAPETRDFDRTLADVRVKILASLWDRLPGPTRDRVLGEFADLAALGDPGAGEQ